MLRSLATLLEGNVVIWQGREAEIPCSPFRIRMIGMFHRFLAGLKLDVWLQEIHDVSSP